MCLLHTHPANAEFDEADIRDFYTHNPDGLGVMWAENDVLYTHKCLPKTGTDAWEFYQKHIQGKNCVVHWRMKTHGLIDLENCHPYTIFGAGSQMPMSLMHNGVLSIGNNKDVSKSDTWHYVEDYLKPLFTEYPEMFNNPIIHRLIANHIGGGNRFIMLNNRGDQVIINEKDFVAYKGALLSNTYAWASWKGGFGGRYASYFQKGQGQGWRGQAWQEDEEHWYGGAAYTYVPPSSSSGTSSERKPVETESSLGQTKAAELRRAAQAFFHLLSINGALDAFATLSFVQVEDCAEDCGTAIWGDFIKAIEGDKFSDAEIIACIEDSNHLIEVLYGLDPTPSADIKGDLLPADEWEAMQQALQTMTQRGVL